MALGNKYCSFCDIHEADVRKLISGANACICDKCVDVCMDVLRETFGPEYSVSSFIGCGAKVQLHINASGEEIHYCIDVLNLFSGIVEHILPLDRLDVCQSIKMGNIYYGLSLIHGGLLIDALQRYFAVAMQGYFPPPDDRITSQISDSINHELNIIRERIDLRHKQDPDQCSSSTDIFNKMAAAFQSNQMLR